MLIGYARVSTKEQNLDLQLDALRAAGCERTFHDRGVSGTAKTRPGLDRALKALRPGDVLAVYRLDRFGRSLSQLVHAITELGERGIAFKSLNDPVDTTNASGRLILHVMAALAEFERSLLVERTQAGLAAAKKRGQKLGRQFALTPDQAKSVRQMVEQGMPVAQVARTMRLHRATVYRYLQAPV